MHGNGTQGVSEEGRATMEPQINPAFAVRRRRAIRLCAAAALGLMLLLIEQTAAFAQTDKPQADEPLGFIKANRVVIEGQIDLAISHLTSALATLESSESPADLEAASTRAYQAYRLMRFAEWGLMGLSAKRVANPIYEMARENLFNARELIRPARLRLEGAAKWPENSESPSWRMDAISKLKDALLLAQQARMLT